MAFTPDSWSAVTVAHRFAVRHAVASWFRTTPFDVALDTRESTTYAGSQFYKDLRLPAR